MSRAGALALSSHTFVSSLKLGVLFALGACSTGNEWHPGDPTSVSGAEVVRGCALGVPGARIAVESTANGVALTFTAPARLDELRARVRHAAAMHGRNARRGPGHEGTHFHSARHGLQAMQLPTARTSSIDDIDRGTRIELVPVEPADREILVMKSYIGADRLNAAPCR